MSKRNRRKARAYNSCLEYLRAIKSLHNPVRTDMRLLSYGVVSVQKKVKTGLVTDLNLIKANLSCKQHCKFWIFHVNKGQLIFF